MNRDMVDTIDILKKENCYFTSEIKGLTDIIWSMGVRTVYSDSELLKTWFNSKIPAFSYRIPMDIIREDGEEALYNLMLTIPC